MSAVQPKDLPPGIAQRGAIAHFQEPDNNSLGHLEEDVSRLQSAINPFLMTIAYKLHDLVEDGGTEYRCIVALSTVGPFVPSEWKPLGGLIQEIGRTTVTGAAVNNVQIILTKITKYMRINFFANNATGSLVLNMTFNEDNVVSNGKYTEHEIEVVEGDMTGSVMDALAVGASETATDDYAGEVVIDVNLALKPKTGSMKVTAPNGLDTENEPYIREASLLWLNLTEQIATIEFVDVSDLGPNDGIGIGSEFIAMGWD